MERLAAYNQRKELRIEIMPKEKKENRRKKKKKTNPICSTVEPQSSFQVKHELYTLTAPFSRKCARLEKMK